MKYFKATLKLYSFLVVFNILMSCDRVTEYNPNDNPIGKSILDIEYINDTLNLNLVDFRISKADSLNYQLYIYLITNEPKTYLKGHKFFVHFYPYNKPNTRAFLPFGTDNIEKLGDTLIFKRKFSAEINQFELVRYGLENNSKERLFNLKIDSVNLE